MEGGTGRLINNEVRDINRPILMHVEISECCHIKCKLFILIVLLLPNNNKRKKEKKHNEKKKKKKRKRRTQIVYFHCDEV